MVINYVNFCNKKYIGGLSFLMFFLDNLLVAYTGNILIKNDDFNFRLQDNFVMARGFLDSISFGHRYNSDNQGPHSNC